MDKRTSRILLVVSSIIALGGIGYFIYSKRREKKMAEIYQKSIQDMANKYQIFK
jgi:hypothetical protein